MSTNSIIKKGKVHVGIQKGLPGAPFDLEFQNKFVVSQKRLLFAETWGQKVEM
jgi:hypothetical protein